LIALYIIGGILLLLVLLLLLPLGISAEYEERMHLHLQIGPVRRTLYPREKGKKMLSEGKKTASEPVKRGKPNFMEVQSALPPIWEGLQRGLHMTRRKVRIDPAELEITFGGDDPADIARAYGWANSAMWRVMPLLEQLVRMPRPHVRIVPDFDAKETAIKGAVGLRCRAGGLLAIAVATAKPVLRWYWPRRKQLKQNQSPSVTVSEQTGTERKDGTHGNE